MRSHIIDTPDGPQEVIDLKRRSRWNRLLRTPGTIIGFYRLYAPHMGMLEALRHSIAFTWHLVRR